MRAKRKYEGQQLLFDASTLFDARRHKQQTLLKMRGQQRSYESPSGIKFYWDHPFQWVPQDDLLELLSQAEPVFERVTIEQAEDYYLM